MGEMINMQTGRRRFAAALTAFALVTSLFAAVPASVFAVVSSPTVTSASPSALGQGASGESVVITGTGFVSGATVTFSGTGVTATSTTFINMTNLVTDVTVTAGAAIGLRDITVTNPDTGSGVGVGVFTVNAGPTVTLAAPVSLAQGATAQNVTVTGTGFVSGATVAFSGSGVTVNSVTYALATSLIVNVTIAPCATLGLRDITVTNPDWGVATGIGLFMVTPSVVSLPSVVSAIPSSLGRGATAQNVVIAGTCFVTGATVAFSGTGITVNSVVFNSATSLTANVTLAVDATIGLRNVTVTNPDTGAGTGTGIFTVNAAPTVTLAAPASMIQGAMGQNVVITGTGFLSGATVAFSGTGITVNLVAYTSPTSLTANISLSSSATPGLRNITVTNPDTGTGTGTGLFTVVGGITNPTVVSATPSSLNQGAAAQNVILTGTGFVTGATVAFSGTGITVNSVVFTSATSLTANVTLAASATVGLRNVTVTNPDTGFGVGTGIFTVTSTGTANHLSFTEFPVSGVSGQILYPPTVVQVVDAGGNPVVGSYAITLSLTAFTGSGTFSCLTNPSWTNALTGAATFTGCQVTGSGTFFFQASTPGLASGGASTTFVITGTSSQVVFTRQPLGATLGGAIPAGAAGVAWAIQPIVTLQNLSGTTLTSDFTTQVTLSVTAGTPIVGGPGILTCTGGNTAIVYAGVATFSGCSINIVGTSYQIRATVSAAGTPVTVPLYTYSDSLPFNIGTTTQVVYATQPLGASSGIIPTAAAGAAWPIQPVVTIQSAVGVPLTSDYSTQVTLSVTPLTPTSGTAGILTCTGGNIRTVVAGVATFAGCAISSAGTAYRLRATINASSTVTVGGFIDSFPFTLTSQVTPTITLATYPSLVVWGNPFSLTVQFTGAGNHAFTVQRLAPTDNGVWQNILTGTTDSTGNAVLQYTPRFDGQYKIVFAGDTTLSAGVSNITTVNVRNLVLLRPQWTGVKTVSRGFTQTYTATVRPVPSGGLTGGVGRVEFQFWQMSGGSWAKVKTVVVTLDSSGVGSLKYTWNATGIWYVRAVTQPNIYNFIGSSPTQRVNVN